VSAIEPMHAQRASGTAGLPARSRPAATSLLVCTAALILFALTAAPALGVGQASSGELLFYPCTSCHPVTDGVASGALPNDFAGHQIELVGHDVLGEGIEACVVCHDDPSRDPGKLRVLGGGFVDAGGDISRACYTCHAGMYEEWAAGIHGRDQPTCTSAGCHDPHSPSWIYGDPLLPFVGTGFQVRAVSDSELFTPLAAYPVSAPVYTPPWLWFATAAAAAIAIGLVVYMLRGRPAR
jgi:hypothetical protein